MTDSGLRPEGRRWKTGADLWWCLLSPPVCSEDHEKKQWNHLRSVKEFGPELGVNFFFFTQTHEKRITIKKKTCSRGISRRRSGRYAVYCMRFFYWWCTQHAEDENDSYVLECTEHGYYKPNGVCLEASKCETALFLRFFQLRGPFDAFFFQTLILVVVSDSRYSENAN